jgi:hypothetical protein
MSSWRWWRHYFFDLPLFALGLCFKRLDDWDRLSGDRDPVLAGIEFLRHRFGDDFSSLPDEEIARRANLVKLVRESDTYASLLINRRRLPGWFAFKGLTELYQALQGERPVIFLGGHLGSNYTMWIALDRLGCTVYPVARAVDRSPATPRARQAYLNLTYRLTDKKWRGRYLFADAHGHFPRGEFPGLLDDVFQRGGICFAAIDFPPGLFTGKQEKVPFLGGMTLLPSHFIQLGLKKNARFFTILEGVEVRGRQKVRQIYLQPIADQLDAGDILRVYAERLTAFICREPWQWMGLAIAQQYTIE